MVDPHPWKPDPSDTRTPIAPPDTVSMNLPRRLSQVLEHLSVQNHDDVGRARPLTTIGGCRICLGFLEQPFEHIGRQAEEAAALHLMHRRGAGRIQTALVVPHEPGIHTQDMFIGRVIKRVVRQLHGGVKEGIGFLFDHAAILGRVRVERHSEFPRVVAMSASSLFFGPTGYTNGFKHECAA